MKKYLLLLIIPILLTGCGNKNPLVAMDIADYGTIKIELYPDIAPNTVANFVNLIEDGFYDGLTFHRVSPGFVIQGGDPNGDGTGDAGYTIAGEFSQNGFANNLQHNRGIISMARAKDFDSAGSQFFIVLDDSAKTSLDGLYAGFGKVIKGMDIIDKIVEEAQIEDERTGLLKENIKINKVIVNTFDKKYKVKKN